MTYQKINPLKLIKDYEIAYREMTGKKLLLQTDHPHYQFFLDVAFCLNNREEMFEDNGFTVSDSLADLDEFYWETLGTSSPGYDTTLD